MILCSWKQKVAPLERTGISKAMPKGWRSNDPGATDIPLTKKCGSGRSEVAKTLSQFPES